MFALYALYAVFAVVAFYAKGALLRLNVVLKKKYKNKRVVRNDTKSNKRKHSPRGSTPGMERKNRKNRKNRKP